jgi:predicted alpha/beta-fold hydrolase
LLGISSLDDPIAIKEALPIDEFINNENCILLATEKGGHVGFLEGFLFLSVWYYKPALEFIDALIALENENSND